MGNHFQCSLLAQRNVRIAIVGKKKGIQRGMPLWQFAAFAVLAPKTILAGCLCGSVTQCHEISECQRTACDIGNLIVNISLPLGGGGGG